jgi:hypothetical protein
MNNSKPFFAIKLGLVATLLIAGQRNIYASTVVTYSGPGGVIVDADSSGPGAVTSDIVIGSMDTICSSAFQDCGDNINNVTVSIQRLQHPFVGDLIATLTAVTPSVSRDIFNRILKVSSNPMDLGCQCQFNDTYFFGDQSTTYSGDIWANAASKASAESIDPGFYWTTSAGSNTPASFSAAFNGLPAAGTWRLTISDNNPDDPPDSGSFLGWTLSVNVVPEPSFAIPLGLALLGLVFFGRRRLSGKRAS